MIPPKVTYRFCILYLVVFCFAGMCRCPAETAVSGEAAQTPFEFHSGFWINLHHFLYRQALSSEPQTGPNLLTLTDADAAELQQLSPEERASWDAAISYYKDFLVNRDLLFDNYMVAIKNQLGDAESSSDLLSVPAELKKALLKAAPVYRKHWWPNHDSRNRQWILELKPLLHKYGSGISMALVTIYDESWPQRPVRADAVAYANWAGAYTTIEPTRPTISTTDPANQGVAALEIVFHETSHGMVDKVADSIRAAERNVNALHPGRDFSSGSLWHAALFYTAGELVAERVSGLFRTRIKMVSGHGPGQTPTARSSNRTGNLT